MIRIKKISHDKGKWITLHFLILVIAITGVFYTVWGEKYIYQDGAWYFFDVLYNNGFQLYPIGRRTAHIIQQLPVVIASRIGVNNIKTMGIIMGISYSVWIYILWGCMLSVCKKYKRIDIAEVLSVFLMITVLFIGFFTIIESTLGASLYCLELALFLLHKDEKTVSSTIEAVAMAMLTILTFHFNEYYLVWSIILASALSYRVYTKELSKLWLAVAALHVAIAIQAKFDMAGRGNDQPVFRDTIERMLQNKLYFVYLALIITVVVFSYDIIKFKGKSLITVVLCLFLAYLLARRVYFDSATIAVGSYPMRFTTFGWGILFGFFVLITEITKHDVEIQHNLLLLCLILAVIIVFFNRRTAHQLRDFHSWEVGYCYNHPNEGYIPITETQFYGSQFNADWVGTLGAFDAEMLRGIKNIGSVIDTSWADVFGRLDRERGQHFEKYGITINYDAFEDNPQVDFEF